MRSQDFMLEVNAAGELTVDPDLIKRFTDRGWEIDGEGRDQIVMSKPGSNTVIKIVGQGSEVRQAVVRRYVSFFRANQRNPHFPRVGLDKTLRWNSKTYYVYTQERLWSLPGDEAVLDYLEQAMATVGRGDYPDYDQVPPGLTAQQVDGLVRAVDQLYGSGQADQYEFDLGNVANIMQRANGQLVIVDPLSDFMSESVVREARASQDGLNIHYEYSADGKTLYVTAMDGTGERELGSVYFTDTGHGWEGEELQVDERYRGQGIARVMYDFAKSQLGRIVPNANQTDAGRRHWKGKEVWEAEMGENFADGRVKGKSRPGRVKRSGASCKGSVTDLRAKARKYSGEKSKMYHWCANMKSGRAKNKD